jgi:hypothetical protein
MLAAMRGHQLMMAILLKRGANINAIDNVSHCDAMMMFTDLYYHEKVTKTLSIWSSQEV